MKNIILSATAILLLVVILFSCKKDKNASSTTIRTTYPNYAQLAVGNYWIYAIYNIDSSGNATNAGTFDSCYIDKDTVINGIKYYRMNRPIDAGYTGNNNATWLRDTLGYVISSTADTFFSSTDIIDTLNVFYTLANPAPPDTLAKIVLRRVDGVSQITVPAGTFTTYACEQTDYIYPRYAGPWNPRKLYTRYAQNVGIVEEDAGYYVLVSTVPQRRLLRYHVAQ